MADPQLVVDHGIAASTDRPAAADVCEKMWRETIGTRVPLVHGRLAEAI